MKRLSWLVSSLGLAVLLLVGVTVPQEVAPLRPPGPPPPTRTMRTLPLPPGDFARPVGEDLFEGTCATCHGRRATGIPHLGKDLVHSWFVESLTTPQLVSFVKRGRPVDDPMNTTGVAMPARGGRTSLTDDEIEAIVEYVHSLHNVRMVDR